MTEQQQGQAAALETEAAELQQDIKEARTEAAAERVAGNDERAERLEASIKATQDDLAEIKATLAEIKGRPYAPAPGDGEAPPATEAGATETKTDDGQAAAEGDTKPKKRHWMFGDRWNQD